MSAVGFDDVFARETVAWRDKTLVVTPPSYTTQGAFKSYLEREVIAGIERGRGVVSAETFRAQLAEHNHAYASKKYGWGMPDTQECLRAIANLKKLFTLILTQPGIDGVRPEAAGWLGDDAIDEIWKDLDYVDANGVTNNKLLDAYDKVMRPLVKAPAPPQAPASDSTPTK